MRQPRQGNGTYATRSGAVRAARTAAKRALGPRYEAYEGPDYEIHPLRDAWWDDYRYKFILRGPAKDGEA